MVYGDSNGPQYDIGNFVGPCISWAYNPFLVIGVNCICQAGGSICKVIIIPARFFSKSYGPSSNQATIPPYAPCPPPPLRDPPKILPNLASSLFRSLSKRIKGETQGRVGSKGGVVRRIHKVLVLLKHNCHKEVRAMV